MARSQQTSVKQINLSKRAHVFYLEHVRVMVEGARVLYIADTGRRDGVLSLFNLPDRNTAFLLLGKGCSITDGAVRMLAESSVLVGFCGSGGSPLIMAAQNEYRPTKYMQAWVRMWMDDVVRLSRAKEVFHKRVEITCNAWSENEFLLKRKVQISDKTACDFKRKIDDAKSEAELLSAEGVWAKNLYRLLASMPEIDGFRREEGLRRYDTGAMRVNAFLDHGNYIAYGYAAVSLYALGISFAFPLFHGKTRRGGLVFDIADLVKDAYVMPAAFETGSQSVSASQFREILIDLLQGIGVVDRMIDIIKGTIQKSGSQIVS